MQNNIETKYQERKKLFDDLYSGIIPERIPISFNLSSEVSIQNAGLPMGKTLWTLEGLEEAIENVVKDIPSDIFPKDNGRLPLFSVISGSKSSVMSSSGFMQHPEFTAMEVDEYDDFINNPYDCIIEKILPRLLSNLGAEENANRRMMIFYNILKSRADGNAKYGAIYNRLAEKYGFYQLPAVYQSRALAPFDVLADHPRGFTGIMKDIKRCPQKVLDAVEAILPMQVAAATPSKVSHLGQAFMPGHMPTFMRTKEFEKFYYPTFSKLIHATAEIGQSFYIFCEDNWTRYLDYLYDLPQGTRLLFEYGDPKLVKEKLGKKHIISGFYPITLLKTGTKQECIDKAKELIDILAPGGNYYFSFDKTVNAVNVENLQAVIQYVAENGKYSNAGEKSMVENREDTIHKVRDQIPEFKSKYYMNREEYEKTHSYILPECEKVMYDQVHSYENALFKSIVSLV